MGRKSGRKIEEGRRQRVVEDGESLYLGVEGIKRYKTKMEMENDMKKENI